MHDEIPPSSEDGEDPTSAGPDAEAPAEDEQDVPARGDNYVSLRAAIEAGQSIESLGLPPSTINAINEMQRSWAAALAPFAESQRRLAQSLQITQAAQTLLPMAEAVKAIAIPPSQWASFVTLSKALAAAYAPAFEQTRELQRQLVAIRLQATLAQLASLPTLTGTSAPPRSYCPSNWDAHSWPADDIQTAMEILSDEGIPLAWVPRAGIVADLVHAPDAAARHLILAAHVPEIIADCRTALGAVDEPDLKDLVELTQDAVTALETTPRSAQALAANIIDTFLRDANRRGRMFGGNFGYFKTQKVTRRITGVSGSTPVSEFREACVLTPALLALKDFDPENDPMPTEFGRHSTVHRAHPLHYTTANAVIAVMLAVSFLREAQQSGW